MLLEQIAEKVTRAFGDHDRVRPGSPLQTRRQVRRIANDAALLRLTRPYEVADYDQASRDADASLERRARLQRVYRHDQL